MSGTALLLGIHHVEQIFILFILGHKLSPFGLITNFSSKQFIFEQSPEINTIVSFPEPLLFLELFFMLLFHFHNVLSKNADSIVWMKIFVGIEISKLGPELIPFGVVAEILSLHEKP
jgi:hypothetical protein